MIVYCITNLIDDKKYIGLSRKSGVKRIKEHISSLTSNRHKNKHLQNAWNKYGIDSFKVEILEECLMVEEIMALEKYYIKYFNSADIRHGYNKTFGGELNIPNEETRRKMSRLMEGKYQKEKNPFYGKAHTEEVKRAISQKAKARVSPWIGRKHSEATKKHNSENCWSRGVFGKLNPCSKRILGINPEGIEMSFFSLKDASLFCGCSKGNICSVCKKRWNHTKNWKFEYIGMGF